MYFGSEHSTDFIALVLDYSGATPGIQLQYNLGSGIQTAVGPYIQQDILYSSKLIGSVKTHWFNWIYFSKSHAVSAKIHTIS